MVRVMNFPTRFNVVNSWGTGASSLVSGFLTKGIGLRIVVESVSQSQGAQGMERICGFLF